MVLSGLFCLALGAYILQYVNSKAHLVEASRTMHRLWLGYKRKTRIGANVQMNRSSSRQWIIMSRTYAYHA